MEFVLLKYLFWKDRPHIVGSEAVNFDAVRE